MIKNKVIIIVLLIALFLIINGCQVSESDGNQKDITTSRLPLASITPTVEETITPTIAAKTHDLTLGELSVKAYESFVKNQTKVSFDRFMPKDYFGDEFFRKGSEYTLSEVLAIVTARYFEHFTKNKINNIEYGYIDCGHDGVNELVLRFNGMDIYDQNDNSTLVYIIKYIEGKLSLCYCYETWARSDTTMNEYGYYESGGSGGASTHSCDYGIIDKDGNWRFIVAIESELELEQLAQSELLERIPKVAKEKGITGGIELDTIRFDYSPVGYCSTDNLARYYTFYVDDNNINHNEEASLYTNSIYKEIFDEAKIPFVTPDEISALISEKEKSVGATTEIKEGKEMTWNSLNDDLFSDYVGR